MEISLIYPHQLFADHPALQQGRPVALIEDPLFFGTDPRWPLRVHWQRLLLHRASMACFAAALQEKGWTVVQQHHDAAADTAGHLELLRLAGYRCFHLADPVDDVLERRIRAFVQRHDCQLTLPTPMRFPNHCLAKQIARTSIDISASRLRTNTEGPGRATHKKRSLG